MAGLEVSHLVMALASGLAWFWSKRTENAWLLLYSQRALTLPLRASGKTI